MPKKPFDERYVVDPVTGCHIWVRKSKTGKYGWCGHRKTAHREAWERVHGPIPEGMFVLHKCDTPQCVFIEHLGLGTNSDNIQDAIAKGRVRGTALSKQDRAEIFDMHQSGMTQKEVAALYNIPKLRVSRIWRRGGYERGRSWAGLYKWDRPAGEKHPHSKLTDAERDQIWDMRFSGWNCIDIGKAYGVTEGAVSYIWLKRGYRTREFVPRKGRRKRGKPKPWSDAP